MSSLMVQWLKKKKICLPCRRPGFNPSVGKIPWRKAWQPTPIIFPGESLEQNDLSKRHHRLQWLTLLMHPVNWGYLSFPNQGFLNLSTTVICSWMILSWEGLSCALYNIYQQPWPLCNSSSPAVLPKKCFQTLPNIPTCVCMLSHFNCVQFFVILWTIAYQLLSPWDFPGKNPGMGYHSFSRGSSQPMDQTHVSYIGRISIEPPGY